MNACFMNACLSATGQQQWLFLPLLAVGQHVTLIVCSCGTGCPYCVVSCVGQLNAALHFGVAGLEPF